MTFTYNNALTSDKDRVRLLIGDTNDSDQLLQDEEIAYFLTLNADPKQAAVFSARAIAANFSRLADRSIESASVRYSQKARNYLDLADLLEKQASSAATGGLAGPSATGISVAAIDAARLDTDRPPSENTKGMFSNPPNYQDRRFRE